LDAVTSTNTACACGAPAVHNSRDCHRCYMREWRANRKQKADWFDWEAVERAWDGKPVGRRLTHAERVYLCSLLVGGEWTPNRAGRLLGMLDADAAQLASDVSTGRIVVPVRGPDGRLSDAS